MKLYVGIVVLMSVLSLTACGGGSTNDLPPSPQPPQPPPPPPPSSTYTIGGTITGLAGSGLILQNNGGSSLTLNGNGAFSFVSTLSTGASYNVTVLAQPTAPAQTCVVSGGSGTVTTANVSNITVACTTVSAFSLTTITPADGEAGVARNVVPSLQFSASVDAATATAANITLTSNVGAKTTIISTVGTQVSVRPTGNLLPLTDYTLSVTPGVRGAAGESLSNSVMSRFTTRDGVWRGPILLSQPVLSLAGPTRMPHVAFDPSGNAIAVWREVYDPGFGTLHNIVSSRYTAGMGWGPPERIGIAAQATASPRIATDSSGNAIAVWHQVDGSFNSVYANRYVSGVGWGIATPLEQVGGHAYNPQIAIDANGNAVVVWGQSDGIRPSIWANRYAVGTGWGTATVIESHNDGDAAGPDVGLDASGNAIVTWTQNEGTLPNIRSNIWANRYVTGVGWGTEARINIMNMTDARDAFNARVAVDASGNALAVWAQNDGTRNNLWSNRYVASTGWGTAALIELEDSIDATAAQIVLNASGNGIAVWRMLNGNRYNIWSNTYVLGTGWGTATLIEQDDAGNALEPQVAIDSNGNGIAVWYQSDGTRNNIFANRLVAGRGWGTPTLIENELGSTLDPQIAIDANGTGMAVWVQLDGSTYRTWANRFE